MQKSVLITGAARGIGAAIALKFAKAGYQVGIHYHTSKQAATTLAEALRRSGHCLSLIHI